MNKKVWIIIAIFLIFIGLIVFCVVMNKLNWDFTKLSTNIFETHEYVINDDFSNIKIITDTADVEFLPSEDLNSLVVCNEQKNLNHLVKVEDNTLFIEVVDMRKWYEYIGINFNTPKITIYLPKGEYSNLLVDNSTGDIKIPNHFKFLNMDISASTGDVMNNASADENMKINTSTGDIFVQNINTNMVELSVSTGDVDIINVNCSSDIKINVSTGRVNIVDTNSRNIISKGNTGNVFLQNVIAREKFLIERSTGDIKFKDCDANDVFIKTDTGDVIGNFLTEKVFFAESNTGSINVPKVVSDKKCEIITDTGDIKITVD